MKKPKEKPPWYLYLIFIGLILLAFFAAAGIVSSVNFLLPIIFNDEPELEAITIEISRLPSEWRSASTTISWVSDPVQVGQKLSHQSKDLPPWSYSAGYFEGSTKACTIWAYEPTGAEDKEYLEYLGHEVLHCFRGYFHSD